MSDFEPTDMVLRVDVSHIPEVQAGDHVVVRETTSAEPGQIVVARNKGGYTLTRAPVPDGFEITARVVGVMRSLP